MNAASLTEFRQGIIDALRQTGAKVVVGEGGASTPHEKNIHAYGKEKPYRGHRAAFRGFCGGDDYGMVTLSHEGEVRVGVGTFGRQATQESHTDSDDRRGVTAFHSPVVTPHVVGRSHHWHLLGVVGDEGLLEAVVQVLQTGNLPDGTPCRQK